MDTTQHEPHCPVPRCAERGEGAICLCVGRDKARAVERVVMSLRDMAGLFDGLYFQSGGDADAWDEVSFVWKDVFAAYHRAKEAIRLFDLSREV